VTEAEGVTFNGKIEDPETVTGQGVGGSTAGPLRQAETLP